MKYNVAMTISVTKRRRKRRGSANGYQLYSMKAINIAVALPMANESGNGQYWPSVFNDAM